MANTRSAEKRNRQSETRRVRNQHVLSTLRTQVRKLREAVTKGDATKAKDELVAAVRLISKAASKGAIHKSQAARRISRLAKSVNAPQPAKSAP